MQRRQFITSTVLTGLFGGSLLPETLAQLPKDKPVCVTNKINKKPLKPFYVQPAEGRDMKVTKIKFNQVNNQFCSVEFTVPPNTMGPAPHVHNDLDEVMRVLTGTITILVGEDLFEVKAGGWHMRPHGIVHTFWNAGDEPATFIDFYPNQNFDVFLDELTNMFLHFEKQGISPDSKKGRKTSDDLHAVWGMVIYHDQRKPLMEKYGLK